MVAKSKVADTNGWRHPTRFRGRTIAVTILIILGILVLAAFSIVHWTERQILTTDNWVKMVAPLPHNPVVAGALSTYSVQQLFTSTNLETKIQNALPQQAAFIAPVLSGQLMTSLNKLAQSFIESQAFATIWENANRLASQKLLDSARNSAPSQPNKLSKFNINLSAVKNSISSLIPSSGQPTKSQLASANVNLGANLKVKLGQLRTYIKLVDFLDSVLLLAAFVCLLGAIVISFARRRLVMVIGGLVVVISLLQIIGVKALRPEVIDQIGNQSYKPAVGVVYDTLVASFSRSATIGVVIGLLVFIVAIVTSPKLLRRSKAISNLLKSVNKSSYMTELRKIRGLIKKYIWQIIGVVIFLGLLIIAFALNLDWQGIVRSSLFILLVVEVVCLASARPKGAPMKQ